MGAEVAEAREHQRALYGAPLGELCTQLMRGLGLTQARLAQVLGLSAPMLSQLMSGRRVKIGNPSAVHRIQLLHDLLGEGRPVDAVELEQRLGAIQEEQATITVHRPRESGLAEAVRLLASSAPAEELARLASLTRAPQLAEVLRRASGDAGGSRG